MRFRGFFGGHVSLLGNVLWYVLNRHPTHRLIIPKSSENAIRAKYEGRGGCLKLAKVALQAGFALALFEQLETTGSLNLALLNGCEGCLPVRWRQGACGAEVQKDS